MQLEKAIWIDASGHSKPEDRKKLILTALESGFGHIIVSPDDTQSNKYGRFHMIIADGDEFLLDGEAIGKSVLITSKMDEKRARDLAGKFEVVAIEATDWKVIPLENLIVHYAKSESKLFVRSDSVDESKLFLETMERGADGIIFMPTSTEEIKKMSDLLSRQLPKQELVDGVIKQIRHLGLGDRVCVDTCSLMSIGEGMLIGSSSSGMFLVHSESYESEYVSSRPFRVNAGAVHAYILLPDGTTKYLSELKSGDEVLVVDFKGNSRSAVVGRIKIERRPLLLVEAELNGKLYSTIVQNAETIRLVVGDSSKSVTELMPGDRVTIRVEAGGRHFGSTVEETIRER